MTSATLTNAQLSEFRRDGFIRLPNLVGAAQVETIKRRVEEFLAGDADSRIVYQIEPAIDVPEHVPADGPADEVAAQYPIRKFHRVALYDALFRAYMKSDPVRSVLAAVLGDSFVVYSDIVFMKPAGVGSRQPYHQDRVLGYEINDEAAMAGLWLALDPATRENGCLRFIPGSHRKRLTLEQADEIEREAVTEGIENEVMVEAAPGDAILIDSLALHASDPNRTDVNRWAYSCFCVSCDARFTGPDGSKPDFQLVQGSRKPGRI